MTDRKTHRVALVVLCEAEGVDELDAAATAQIALGQLIRTHGLSDEESQAAVGQVRTACSVCGVSFPDFEGDTIPRHVEAERWSPEDLKRDQMADGYDEPLQDACEGSEKPPRAPREPVVGFVRRDRLPIFTRVHQIMDAGMALGNGYLWAGPTWKGFR